MWPGGTAESFDGAVIVGGDGRVAYLGPADRVPGDMRALGGAGCWVGPGVVDAHVHLAFASVTDCLPAGVVGVRDLGAPMGDALRWRAEQPSVAVAGPILTAPGGYPSRSWGAAGIASFVASADEARETVRRLVTDGVDVVKVALEPGGGAWPVPALATVRAIADAAHAAGLAVVAHALTVAAVRRAVEAGVDELAHTPIERLPVRLVDRIAASGIAVVSTLQTFFADGDGPIAAANARALHRAGVVLRYGTDLGNTGTAPGVDTRELARIAEAGPGVKGALRAATEVSAEAPGVRGRSGRLVVGEPAALVVLRGDPVADLAAWNAPLAVLADRHLVVN